MGIETLLNMEDNDLSDNQKKNPKINKPKLRQNMKTNKKKQMLKKRQSNIDKINKNKSKKIKSKSKNDENTINNSDNDIKFEQTDSDEASDNNQHQKNAIKTKNIKSNSFNNVTHTITGYPSNINEVLKMKEKYPLVLLCKRNDLNSRGIDYIMIHLIVY